jgi:GNAT superfamily N-acetyltransferase
MPDLHTGAEAVSFCGKMIDRGWVRVADVEGRMAGFIARDEEEICSLYVTREMRGSGIGSILLKGAKKCSNRLTLWVFQENMPARAFYERAGFEPVRETQGAANDERLPDVFLEWRSDAKGKQE